MAMRNAGAVWKGDLKGGQGTVKLGSGAFEGSYSFPSRFENGRGTNPEELLGAAHAACFSMALSAGLSAAGHVPTSVHTTAKVHLDRGGDGFAITRIELDTEAEVPGLGEAAFRQQADSAKKNCPISKALAGTQIMLTARLVGAGR
jgi:osmotically inducible protein OsmC